MNELIPFSRRLDDDAPFLLTSRPSLWRRYGVLASAVTLMLALGWSLGSNISTAFRGPSQEQLAATAAAQSAAQALHAAQAQRQEIAALRAHLDSLKTKLESQSAKQAQDSHASEATIANLQKSLAAQKADATATAAQLQAKIDHIQASAIDRTPTGSIPTPPEKPQSNAPANLFAKPSERITLGDRAAPAKATDPAQQSVYRSFVLRDVANGMAVVEGSNGLDEVGPGDTLPGGARVERLEKRGREWVLVTNRGVIAPDGRWED